LGGLSAEVFMGRIWVDADIKTLSTYVQPAYVESIKNEPHIVVTVEGYVEINGKKYMFSTENVLKLHEVKECESLTF
jgi:hypothetical protein